MKVEVPDGVASGAAQVGVGISRKAPIETDDDGTRYVEVSGVAARSLMRQWAEAHDVTYSDAGRCSGGSWGDDGGDDGLADLAPEELTDEHWQTVATAVSDGTLDDVLDDLADVDNRPSVIEAIRSRKAELV